MSLEALKLNKRRKNIDIPEKTFRFLSVKAAAKGTNLKNYIEELLIKEAEDIEDSDLYMYLSSTRPEGKVMLNTQEKKEFEEWLGLNDE